MPHLNGGRQRLAVMLASARRLFSTPGEAAWPFAKFTG
jgi:hypothetical protein